MRLSGLIFAVLTTAVTTGFARAQKLCPECPPGCVTIQPKDSCAKCICPSIPIPEPNPCLTKCPADCRCTIKNGDADCNCTLGPNHPFVNPGTVRPRPPIIQCMPPLCESPCYLYRDKSMVCPGCKCPTEPITIRPRRQIKCIPPLCEPPCYLYKNNSMACTGCQCPTTERVTLRPVIQCMPPICESPCYLFRDKSMVCPGCKCPPDAPLTRSPPVFQCKPPRCESPCYLANAKTHSCLICKCPEF